MKKSSKFRFFSIHPVKTFRSRNDSPDVDPENLASLASEEVFDDESNSSLASARSKNSPNLRRSQRHSSRRLSPTYENSHEGFSR